MPGSQVEVNDIKNSFERGACPTCAATAGTPCLSLRGWFSVCGVQATSRKASTKHPSAASRQEAGPLLGISALYLQQQR